MRDILVTLDITVDGSTGSFEKRVTSLLVAVLAKRSDTIVSFLFHFENGFLVGSIGIGHVFVFAFLLE
jgi:hypothetical protein